MHFLFALFADFFALFALFICTKTTSLIMRPKNSDNMNQHEVQCEARDTKFKEMDDDRLERSLTSHRGILTKYTNLAEIMITKLGVTPSQQAAQQLE